MWPLIWWAEVTLACSGAGKVLMGEEQFVLAMMSAKKSGSILKQLTCRRIWARVSVQRMGLFAFLACLLEAPRIWGNRNNPGVVYLKNSLIRNVQFHNSNTFGQMIWYWANKLTNFVNEISNLFEFLFNYYCACLNLVEVEEIQSTSCGVSSLLIL